MNTARQLLPGIPWFDVPDPASPDLDELAQRFHLHELQIEDTRHRPQQAKVDEYGNYLFAVLKHLHPGDKPMFDDFDVFLGSNFLVTVHQGDAPLLAKLVQRVQENHVERLDRIPLSADGFDCGRISHPFGQLRRGHCEDRNGSSREARAAGAARDFPA